MNRHRYIENPVSGTGTKCNSISSDHENSTGPESQTTISRIFTSIDNLTDNTTIIIPSSERIPATKKKSKKKHKITEEIECPVCFSDCSDEVDINNRNCEHKIHFECIRVMISKNAENCPVCQKRLIGS